jgi:hypothetical protein
VQPGEGTPGGFVKKIAVSLLLLGACTALRADPPAAQFAGAQLGMAEAALEQARAALQAHDYPRARQLAAQAGLDARLAWGMTDSAAVRRAAVEVNRQAERLRWRSLVAAGSPARPAP